MAFNYFLIGLCSLYAAYYFAMFFIDVIKIKKEKNIENQGKEIDIADAVATYQPKVASDIMKKESEEVLAEMNKKDEDDENTENDEDDEDFPFNINESNMFTSSAEDEEDTSSGDLTIQYELSEEHKEEYPDVEMNGGYYAANLKNLIEDMKMQENLFAHIKWNAAV